jgi:hypothetical protein
MQEKPQTANTMGARLKQSKREIKRPNTTAMGQKPPMGAARPFTGFSGIKSVGGNFIGRAKTANYAVSSNPKLRRFETLIDRLKKILESEKKNLRCIKTLCAKEIDSKNQLEKILR